MSDFVDASAIDGKQNEQFGLGYCSPFWNNLQPFIRKQNDDYYDLHLGVDHCGLVGNYVPSVHIHL